MADPVDKKILKQFVPSNALKAENFEELASKTFLESVHIGKTIFTHFIKFSIKNMLVTFMVDTLFEYKSAKNYI